MNQYIKKLVCESFHHVLLKYGYENAEMHEIEFDGVTFQNSIVHGYFFLNLQSMCIAGLSRNLQSRKYLVGNSGKYHS